MVGMYARGVLETCDDDILREANSLLETINW